MWNIHFSKIQKISFAMLAIWMFVLLAVLWSQDNIVMKNGREEEELIAVEEVACQQTMDANSPAGKVAEFMFPLDMKFTHDTNLLFYTSHHWVEVWIDEECVYTLSPGGNKSPVKTPGSYWNCVPVYREDAGKTVRVVLTPAYENHLDDSVEFFLGSSYAVYKSQLQKMFPSIALSLLNIIVGILLLFIYIYFRCVKRERLNLLSVSALGIAMGLWQLCHNDFSPFLLEGKEIFLYYVSVVMLIVCMIPLVWSAGVKVYKDEKKIMQYYLVAVAVMASLQIILQLSGVRDLREMLPITHASIIVGVLLLIINAVSDKLKGNVEKGEFHNVWILGIGVLGDLFLYYMKGSSSGAIMILLAVLIYMLMEGVGFLTVYVERGHMLVEKDNQLIQAKMVTMMSQIRSHFVFNVLNAISGMCKYDPEKADETIVRFARYLRNNIEIMEDDEMVPFDVELQRLEDYILLEQVRFGNRIEFVTNIEEADFKLPPLLLQPIVENSIKHGIMKKQSGGMILLSTRKENGNIIISIDDDGVGFDMKELEKEKSVGLRNIRFRLYHLMKGTLDIKSEHDKGTKVVISFPEKGE